MENIRLEAIKIAQSLRQIDWSWSVSDLIDAAQRIEAYIVSGKDRDAGPALGDSGATIPAHQLQFTTTEALPEVASTYTGIVS